MRETRSIQRRASGVFGHRPTNHGLGSGTHSQGIDATNRPRRAGTMQTLIPAYRELKLTKDLVSDR